MSVFIHSERFNFYEPLVRPEKDELIFVKIMQVVLPVLCTIFSTFSFCAIALNASVGISLTFLSLTVLVNINSIVFNIYLNIKENYDK